MAHRTKKVKDRPFLGTVERLIDRVPFLEGNKVNETWEYTSYFFGIKIRKKQFEVIKEIRNSDFTMSNNSFDFLKGSSHFLNILLNNINSCILMLNKENRLTAFNDNLKTIFSNKKDEDLIYKRCGESIGCAYQIEEQKDCGTTSKCSDCELRLATLNSYNSNENIYKSQISRPFFNSENQKIIKHLQFSTHLFYYHKEKYVIMVIEDMSNMFKPKN